MISGAAKTPDAKIPLWVVAASAGRGAQLGHPTLEAAQQAAAALTHNKILAAWRLGGARDHLSTSQSRSTTASIMTTTG